MTKDISKVTATSVLATPFTGNSIDASVGLEMLYVQGKHACDIKLQLDPS